jgi:hypothetical protein
MAKAPEDRYESCDAFAAALVSASSNVAITKKAVVDLVGTVAVREMGTAGHVFTSGEMPNMAAPRTVSNSVPESKLAGLQSLAGVLPWLRANTMIAVAVAFVFLCIVVGVVAGLSRRNPQAGTTNPPPSQPTMPPQQSPASAGNPVVASPVVQQPVYVPFTNPPQAPPPQAANPPEKPNKGGTKDTPKPKESRRERALRALDQ